MKKILAILIFCGSVLSNVQPLNAGGFLGDIVEGVCGGCGAGKELDKLHDGIGAPLNIPDKIVDEAAVEVFGPALGEAIRHSRNDARAAGTHPIPDWVKFHMSPYFDQDILGRVQFRIGGGGDLSVQANAIRYGEANAVALIDTIVFDNSNSANNLSLWSHELYHIVQFRLWGLTNFGKRYVRSVSTVEDDANRMEAEFDRQHAYILGNAAVHAEGAISGNWVYLGRYNDGWVERNFSWENNGSFLPLLGSKITASTDINIRANHITYDQNRGQWTNANVVRIAKFGELFRVVRLHDVTAGDRFMWAMIE